MLRPRSVSRYSTRVGRAAAPLMGEEVGAALAIDDGMLVTRPARLRLDRDTSEVRRAPGMSATPLAEWAAGQDWQAMASVLGGVSHAGE